MTKQLSNKAYRVYSNENTEERAKILKYLLSNSELKDGKLSYTYKKPFNLFAEGLACIKKHPGLVYFRTFCPDKFVLNVVREMLKTT